MNKKYITSAVAACSLALVATLIISLSSNNGMPGSGASKNIAYHIEQPDTLPPQQQPDPAQDPLMPPEQKPKSEQPPVQRLVAQGEQTQNPYMPPIQEPMPSYGTEQQQMQGQQMQGQQMQGQQIQQQQQPNYYYQTEPQYIEQAPPESCAPPPAETIPNASSSFQPPTPVVPPSPQV